MPHHTIVEALVETLSFRHIGVVQEEYAVSPDGMKMFGVLDLETQMEGCRFSIGIRNSHDKSIRLGLTAGLRVFVCSNMAFSGDFTPVLAKHTKSLNLVDTLSVGVDRIQRNFEPLERQVELWRKTQITDDTARPILYSAFVDGKLDAPRSLLSEVHRLYFEPEYEEFSPRTMWSLSNAFIQAVEEYTGDTINYSISNQSPVPDQVQASLVEMAQLIMVGRVMLPSSTAPFRESVSHPSYLIRALSLVQQSLQRKDISADLRVFTTYVNESLQRMQQARTSGIVELTANDPIAGIQFDELGLVIISNGVFHRVPFAEIRKLVEKDQPASIVKVSENHHLASHSFDSSRKDTALAGLWSAPGTGTIILWGDGHESILSLDLTNVHSTNESVLRDAVLPDRVIVPEEPSPDAVAVGHDPSSAIWIVSFHNDGERAQVRQSVLEQSAVKMGAPPGVKIDLEHSQIVAGAMYSPLIVAEGDVLIIYAMSKWICPRCPR